MIYFNKFPKLSYNFNNSEKEIVDIFRRVVFSTKTLNNKKIFSDYYVTSGETLDSIAYNLYNSSNYTWILMSANNLANPLEFPQGEEYLLKSISETYTGKAIYSKVNLKDIVKAGDVVAKVTLNGSYTNANTIISTTDEQNYAIVRSYDPIMRVLWVDNIVGTLSADDILGIYRLGSDGVVGGVNFSIILNKDEAITQRNFLKIEKISDYSKSVVQFTDATGNYFSPYYYNSTKEVPSNALGIYSSAEFDKLTINGTALQKFVDDDTPLHSGTITLEQKVIQDNSKFRIIKVLNGQYLSVVTSRLFELLSSNERKTLVLDLEV